MKTTATTLLLLSTIWMVPACDPHGKDDTTAVGATTAAPSVWGDAPVNLRASVNYQTGEQHVGQQTTTAPIAFNVPEAIYVQTGNAGNGQAQFQYGSPTAGSTCTYQGASSMAHPTTDLDRMHGLRYLLSSCSDGHTAGQPVTSSWFSLRIVGGDSQDPTRVTSASLALGGGCNAELPAPLAADEVVNMRDGFSWNTMPKLNETDPDGNPAIYHGLIYVESKDQLAALDRLRVYWSAQPFSERYLSTLSGRCGRVGHSTDGRGVVVYALFPAQLFNVMRDFGIQATAANIAPPFRFIIPTPPDDPEYVNSDGSIKYSALGSSGYAGWLSAHPGQQPDWWNPTSWPGDISDVASDAYDWTKDHIVDPAAHYGEYGFDYFVNGFGAAIDFGANLLDDGWKLTEQGLQRFVLLFESRVYLNLKITVMNRDPLFPANTPMTRVWGPPDASGNRPQIVPTGAHVQVQQWGFGFLPVMNQNQLNEDGTVSLTAIQGANGRGGDICIELDTDYASITSDLIPSTVCDFASGQFGNFEHNFDYRDSPQSPANIAISEPDIYSLTQLKDSSDYYKTVIGGNSYTMDVLTGWVANDLTATINYHNGDARAMTPCLHFPGTGASALTTAITAAGAAGYIASSVLGPITTGVALIGSAVIEKDLWLPDEGADPGARLSRGTVTHEYGHYTMCSLLFAQDGPPGLDGLIPRIWGGETERTDELALMTESWADTFAMQVVGGTNYIDSQKSVTGPTKQIGFCMQSPCMDENYTGTNDYNGSNPFLDELARFESLLYDAFDRSDMTQRFTDAPGNGDVWMTDPQAGVIVSPTGYIANSDESVSLSGAAWKTWVTHWLERGEVANKVNVVGGLVDTMADQGYNWCARCELLALHDPVTPIAALGGTEDPTGLPAPTMNERLARWESCVQSPDIASWLGSPPNSNLNMDATCTPCPVHNFVNPSGVCVPCPAGSIAGDGQCYPCEYGASESRDWCLPG